MPIIIDTNCLANVFSRTSAKHRNFEPVLKWIIEGKGVLIYGGKKYKNELIKANKYLRLFRLLREIGKAIDKFDQEIDNLEADIESIKTDAAFDDVHLLAISVVTKCRIICSEDRTSIPYVTSRKYLPPGSSIPVYYTSWRNRNILSDRYVDESLKPLCKISKRYARKIYEDLP